MKYALQALLRLPALNLFQGRLIWPALALGGLLLFSGYPSAWAQPRPDSAKADTSQPWISKRNPWAALGLSMLCPGAGQLYNHEKKKGFLMMGVWIPCYIYTAWFASQIDSMPYHYIHFDKVSSVEVILGIAAGAACLVDPIWSDIDAYHSAKRINRRNGYSGLKNPGVGLVFVPDPRNRRRLQPGVGLRAGFRPD